MSQSKHEYEVDTDGMRADVFLAEKSGKSRSEIKSLIRAGQVTQNGELLSKPSQSLFIGDQLTLLTSMQPVYQLTPIPMHLDIFYEDAYVLVLNKPAGLIVHPGIHNEPETLVHGLLAHTPNLSEIGGALRLGIVHRLDRFTEGLMIVAKTNEVHQALADQFKQRQVQKKYYAMVKGSVERDEFVIESAVGRDPKNRLKMTARHPIKETAKAAHTNVKVLKRFGTMTLLDLAPKTGRTHQLRVHLESIGHPIIGDPLYGSQYKKSGQEQRLQAYFLRFFHPMEKVFIEIELSRSERLSG